MSIWNTILLHPLINFLIFCYQATGGNLGLAIILITVLIRLALLPLLAPSMKSAQKMQELKPELDQLKEKYNKDKQKLAQEQIKLYQKYKINPASGLLPMIFQFLVLIALYQAFNKVIMLSNGVGELNQILYSFIKLPESSSINTSFLYLNLAKPDVFPLGSVINLGIIKISTIPGLVVILAAITQYYSTVLISPKLPDKKKNEADDMGTSMQKQMRIMGPLMTILIGTKFASGLALYWLTYSVFMIIQQLYSKKFQKIDK